jgi:hypothetical protein
MPDREKIEYRFFFGGHDLEMVEIRALLSEIELGDRVVDFGLYWGARASSYQTEIAAALLRGETPVLIELEDDLPAGFDRNHIISIDHHGVRAGAEKPSALRQVYDLVGLNRGLAWTRRHALVDANDIGHVRALRALGITPGEVRTIRDADRMAQGVSDATERESRRAIAAAERGGALVIVRSTAPTSSAIVDFLLSEYGGPGVDDVLVVMPDKVAFFGRGSVIEDLKSVPGWWYGGALPEFGYWGAMLQRSSAEEVVARVVAYFEECQRW